MPFFSLLKLSLLLTISSLLEGDKSYLILGWMFNSLYCQLDIKKATIDMEIVDLEIQW